MLGAIFPGLVWVNLQDLLNGAWSLHVSMLPLGGAPVWGTALDKTQR